MPIGWEKVPPPLEPRTKTVASAGSGAPALPGKSRDEEIEFARTEQFLAESPERTLNDVVLPAVVRSRIDTALSRILYHETLYHGWNLKKLDPHGARTALNFYGPPGTGKTLCAEAIAHHLGKTMIRVSYAEIESKYVGETPKNITAAFKKAKDTDSVLFFDEADSILGKRLTQVTQAADHSVNLTRSVMLMQLDHFDGVVIFATNLQQNYDSAFVRRILAHIEFELPDRACRERLWEQLLPVEVPREPVIDAAWLASISDGLSGGDLRTVILAAAGRAVQRVDQQRYVTRSDFEEEAQAVRRAKASVGAPAKTPITVEEEVPVSALPADVKAQYKLASGDDDPGGLK